MHIRKRTLPSGEVRWQVRLSSAIDGHRIEQARDFSSEREAKAWAQGEGRRIEQSGARAACTVGEYFRQWLDYLDEADQLQPKTRIEYRQRLGRLATLIGHKPLGRLSTRDLDLAYAKLLRSGGHHGGPLHPRTVAGMHRVVLMALKRARRWRLIGDNPAADVERLPAPGRSPMRAPTADELRRYLDAIRPTPWWPFALLAITTGVRRGEACGLRWADIDFERRTLRIAQVVCEAGSKVWIRAKPKTPAGFREISFPPVLAEELVRIRFQQAEERLAYGPRYRRDLDLALCLPGGEPWPPDAITRALSWIARTKAGLPRAVAPLHGLRHGHATALMTAIPLKAVSARLGHSSVEITANTYQHPERALDEAAAAAIEALIRPLVTDRER